MKTMGGKRKDNSTIIVQEEIHFDDVVGDSIELEMEELEEPPQKRHKKHKHKRHKKKKSADDEGSAGPSQEEVEVVVPRTPKPTLKLKIKFAESSGEKRQKEKTSTPKVAEKPPATPPNVMNPASAKILSKKKKGGKGKESGTSSEEERWLDAIESGKLEEVDDELKKIKDPKLMTARQRAMFDKKTEKEPSSGGEQLMALPSGYKEKVVTEEMLQKRALKLLRRKQMAEEKREKDKKKTMDRLLKKQECKTKVVKACRSTRRQVPQISYLCTTSGVSISLPVGMEYPVPKMMPPVPPLPRPTCAVQGCGQPKKYCCSRTKVPLCSFECYKRNLEASRSA